MNNATSLDIGGSESDLCRICQVGDGENDNPLITPCKCTGSVQYVHQSCLQKWIKSSDTRACELCRCEFQMQTKLKPFTKWEKLDMSTSERRKILCSVGFHIIAITCVIWSLYVLIQRTAQEIRKKDFNWPFWTKLIVVGIGFIGGLVFMYVQCKVYVQLWRRLKAYNRVIYVQNHPLGIDNAKKGKETSQKTSTQDAPSVPVLILSGSTNSSNSEYNKTSFFPGSKVNKTHVGGNPISDASNSAKSDFTEPSPYVNLQDMRDQSAAKSDAQCDVSLSLTYAEVSSHESSASKPEESPSKSSNSKSIPSSSSDLRASSPAKSSSDVYSHV